ncbi:MAG: outer membrane protein assembly factor BamB family protein, partial [Planctomycetota bacterium]
MATVVALLALPGWTLHAGNWPQYRADAGRSGYTAEPLPARLSLQWVRLPRHAPQPAWRGRSFALSRMRFDWAYGLAVADGSLYFGSSADCKVYALDAATGRERWSFFAGGPVRLAPAVWKDKVFAVSDDGLLYCLSATDGRCLWKLRGGPGPEMLLGNGQMVSHWVARGGPAVLDGVVYFGAGIWPTDGVYIYAVDAETGKVLWLNDSSGAVEMKQPHLYTFSRSGAASQGYLAVTDDRVLVATGRGVPAAFDRKTGRFLYLHLSRYGGKTPWGLGGGDVVATDEVFFNSGHAFDAATGLKYHRLGRWDWWRRARKNGRLVSGVHHRGERQIIAVTDEGFIRAEGRNVFASKLASRTYQPMREDERAPNKRRREKIEDAPILADEWSVEVPKEVKSLIVAGNCIVLGTEGGVVMLDRRSREIIWSAKVDGAAYDLAAADGRLYVSTDKGNIYCFSGETTAAAKQIKPPPAESPYPADGPAAKAAAEIIRRTGVTKGYCLDLGCGDGALAYELARRTELQIVAIDADAASVAAAREKLDKAGLYGVRVTVLQADPADTHLPGYFANLIVSNAALTKGAEPLPAGEIARLQRPWGGVVCIGRPGEMKVDVRGPLAGAGKWTHQFADAANTMNSGDRLIRGPLGMLWYQDETLETVQRHGKGPAPLFYRGVLLRLGLHALKAV